MANSAILSGKKGAMRIAVLVIGLVVLCLTGQSGAYGKGGGSFLFAMIFILFICSIVWIILWIVGVLGESAILNKDMLINLIGGILILIAAIICLVQQIIYTLRDCKASCFAEPTILYLIAIILALVDGLLYTLLGLAILKGK